MTLFDDDTARRYASVQVLGSDLTRDIALRGESGRDTPAFRPMGSDYRSVMRALGEIESQTRRRIDSVQQNLRFVPFRGTLELDRRSAARRLVSTTVTTPEHLWTVPLLWNFLPDSSLGPAPTSMLLADERVLIMSSPRTSQGLRPVWAITDPGFVRRAVDLRDECLQHARPVGEFRDPLTPRQYDVAQSMCLGETDTAIARRLRISTRSVERDVAALLRYLGAQSRTEAVAKIMGSDYYQGTMARSAAGDRP